MVQMRGHNICFTLKMVSVRGHNIMFSLRTKNYYLRVTHPVLSSAQEMPDSANPHHTASGSAVFVEVLII